MISGRVLLHLKRLDYRYVIQPCRPFHFCCGQQLCQPTNLALHQMLQRLLEQQP